MIDLLFVSFSFDLSLLLCNAGELVVCFHSYFGLSLVLCPSEADLWFLTLKI